MNSKLNRKLNRRDKFAPERNGKFDKSRPVHDGCKRAVHNPVPGEEGGKKKEWKH